MVEIDYKPIEKIIVHEIMKHDYDEFVNLMAVPRPPGVPQISVRWIDGILFSFSSYPLTRETISESLQGTVHWDVVNFTEMTDYQETIFNAKTNTSMHVIDNSNNTAVSDFVRWLKKQPQWFNATVVA